MSGGKTRNSLTKSGQLPAFLPDCENPELEGDHCWECIGNFGICCYCKAKEEVDKQIASYPVDNGSADSAV
jgi:hypothetical protein